MSSPKLVTVTNSANITDADFCASILEDPELRAIILSMVEPQPSPKLEDGSVIPDRPELLSFPTPPEPLREWTEQNLDPAVMIAAIEAVMQIARSQPDFEAQRLFKNFLARNELAASLRV